MSFVVLHDGQGCGWCEFHHASETRNGDEGGGEHAGIVRRIKEEFPEKFQKITSDSDSLRLLVEQNDRLRLLIPLMGKKADDTEIDKLGEFADLLLEPQFRDNINNILKFGQNYKMQPEEEPAANKLRSLVRHEGVDCLTDATLPIAFYSHDGFFLWGCLDNLGRQILCTGYESNRVLSKDFSYYADGVPWEDFMSSWSLTEQDINFKDPEHRKRVNDYFHENFSSRED